MSDSFMKPKQFPWKIVFIFILLVGALNGLVLIWDDLNIRQDDWILDTDSPTEFNINWYGFSSALQEEIKSKLTSVDIQDYYYEIQQEQGLNSSYNFIRLNYNIMQADYAANRHIQKHAIIDYEFETKSFYNISVNYDFILQKWIFQPYLESENDEAFGLWLNSSLINPENIYTSSIELNQTRVIRISYLFSQSFKNQNTLFGYSGSYRTFIRKMEVSIWYSELGDLQAIGYMQWFEKIDFVQLL
jgi:hypothetical protein